MAPHVFSPLTPSPIHFNSATSGGNTSSLQRTFFAVVKQQRLEDLIDFLSMYVDQIDLDAVERRTGFSALSLASIEGSVRKVRKLIKMGADPRRLDAHGYACIHYAMAYGHSDLSSYLVKNGIC